MLYERNLRVADWESIKWRRIATRRAAQACSTNVNHLGAIGSSWSIIDAGRLVANKPIGDRDDVGVRRYSTETDHRDWMLEPNRSREPLGTRQRFPVREAAQVLEQPHPVLVIS